MNKKLYRSNSQKMIAGVCGGIAEYVSIDPTIVRLIWAFLCLWGGWGLVLYLVAMFIIPQNPIDIIEQDQ